MRTWTERQLELALTWLGVDTRPLSRFLMRPFRGEVIVNGVKIPPPRLVTKADIIAVHKEEDRARREAAAKLKDPPKGGRTSWQRRSGR